jgi:hypothetical protein
MCRAISRRFLVVTAATAILMVAVSSTAMSGFYAAALDDGRGKDGSASPTCGLVRGSSS